MNKGINASVENIWAIRKVSKVQFRGLVKLILLKTYYDGMNSYIKQQRQVSKFLIADSIRHGREEVYERSTG